MLERPQLRSHLAAEPADREQVHYLVWDQLRLSPTVLKVTALQLQCLQLFDGEHSLREIQSEASRQLGGYLIPLETKQRLVDEVCTGDEVTIDIPNKLLTNKTTGDTWELLGLGDVAPILEAGGIFNYAKKIGMAGV